ncbi:MAG: hypothetical protein K0R87_481 [Pseudonocardia sp.]|nr:hypothetical protein [Pseudonocardia sp.]
MRDAIEQGISTFRSLRRGEPAEKIAADAARYLPVEFRKDQQYNWFVAKPMGKAVTALTAVSGSQGGSGYYFAKYCLAR